MPPKAKMPPTLNPVVLFHHFFLSQKPRDSTLADIDLSLSPSLSLSRLRNHHFTTKSILHYLTISLTFLLVLYITPSAPLIKLSIIVALATLLTIPLTLQFFLPALPILAWVAFFFLSPHLPHHWRPPISVKVLPALETILYGDNLLNVLAAYTLPVLDILAWLPYGIIHFSMPFVVAGLLFLFGPPTCLRAYGLAFGYMNLCGVVIQNFIFPAAPPWYKLLHGLDPANYDMDGLPGGLGRIDDILGFDMYTTAFTNLPLVFGAVPSLHLGNATILAMFMSYLFPRLTFVWWGYVCVLWWSTMYLTHHYFIDLMAGACLLLGWFLYVRYTQLPEVVPGNWCRWNYDQVKVKTMSEDDPLGYAYLGTQAVELEVVSGV